MKRTGSCLFATLLLVGSSTLAMAGAYGEEEVTQEVPTAPATPPAAVVTTEAKVETNFGRSGGYIEVGGVYVVQNFDSDAGIKGASLDDADNTGGYEIRVGYRINKMFAMEAEWEQYLHYSNVHTNIVADPGANLDQWGFTMNGKFYPLSGRFQPYALLGVGATKAEFEASSTTIRKQDEAGFVLRFGAGLDVYITESFGVAFEAGYLLPFMDAQDFDVIPFSGSLFYRFG